MLKIHRYCFRCVLCLLILTGACSEGQGQLLKLRTYTTNDGLISNSVRAITQDASGYLWLANDEGLSRYDGLMFRNFTTLDGLPMNFLNSISESKFTPKQLWIGTNGSGICVATIVNNEGDLSFSTILPDTILEARRVGKVVEVSRDELWCVTNAGIYRIKNKLSSERITDRRGDVVVTETGEVWVGYNRTMIKFTGRDSNNVTLQLPAGSNGSILRLFSSRRGDVWVATTDSMIFRYKDARLRSVHHSIGGPVLNIQGDDSNNLWFFTQRKIFAVSVSDSGFKVQNIYGTEHGFPSQFISAAFIDREENIWVSFFTHSLVKWSNRELLRFHLPLTNVPNNGTVTSDSSGHLWIAGTDGLYELWRDGSLNWKRYRHNLTEQGQVLNPRSVVIDTRGSLWVNYLGGDIRGYRIKVLDNGPSKLVQHTVVGGSLLGSDANRHCFIIDRNYFLWCSLAGVGVSVVDLNTTPTRVNIYDTSDGLRDLSVRALYADERGNVWMGSFNGGVVVAPAKADRARKTTIIDESQGLPEGGVRSFIQDDLGRMWIGTRYGGIYLLDRGQYSIINSAHGLKSNAIWSMARHPDGSIWAGTSLGLQQIDTRTLAPVAMKADFFGSTANACGVFDDGTLWFTTAEALIISGNYHHPLKFPPPVHLRGLTVNGNPSPLLEKITLSHNENNCSIHFIGVSFRGDIGLQYKYRLVGIDSSWSVPTHEHTVTYAALQPGEYRFEVKAITDWGSVSENPAQLTLSILQPYWAAWWFRLVIAGIIIGTVGVILRRRFQVVRLEAERQTAFSKHLIDVQERERKRIASELHDGLGQNLILIQYGVQQSLTLSKNNPELTAQLNVLAETATESIGEVREISYDLHPHTLDQLGLRKAILAAIDKCAKASAFVVTSDIDEFDQAIPKDQEIHVYRIIQESLNNITKHAAATHVVVRIKQSYSGLSISISDDGKGFDMSTLNSREGERRLGIAGLTERARILGGSLTLTSTPGRGTSLVFDIPNISSNKESAI